VFGDGAVMLFVYHEKRHLWDPDNGSGYSLPHLNRVLRLQPSRSRLALASNSEVKPSHDETGSHTDYVICYARDSFSPA
jgi:hypothetical protein